MIRFQLFVPFQNIPKISSDVIFLILAVMKYSKILTSFFGLVWKEIYLFYDAFSWYMNTSQFFLNVFNKIYIIYCWISKVAMLSLCIDSCLVTCMVMIALLGSCLQCLPITITNVIHFAIFIIMAEIIYLITATSLRHTHSVSLTIWRENSVNPFSWSLALLCKYATNSLLFSRK